MPDMLCVPISYQASCLLRRTLGPAVPSHHFFNPWYSPLLWNQLNAFSLATELAKEVQPPTRRFPDPYSLWLDTDHHPGQITVDQPLVCHQSP